jgi:hypothetical protein
MPERDAPGREKAGNMQGRLPAKRPLRSAMKEREVDTSLVSRGRDKNRLCRMVVRVIPAYVVVNVKTSSKWGISRRDTRRRYH